MLSLLEAAIGVVGACMPTASSVGVLSIMKVSRREAGVLKVRNSFVGEISAGFSGVPAVPAGTRLPFKLASARGSIDLRRRLPPRGTRDVSIA